MSVLRAETNNKGNVCVT